MSIGAAVVLGVWLGPIGVVVVGLWLTIVSGLTGRLDWVLTTIVLLGFLLGVVRGIGAPSEAMPADAMFSSGGTLATIGFPRPDIDGDSIRARVHEFQVDSNAVNGADVTILAVFPPGITVARGDIIRVTDWKFDLLDSFSPGYARYLRSLGVGGRAEISSFTTLKRGPAMYRWFATFRGEVSRRLRQAIPGDAGALAAGIVTGDDSALSPGATRDFLDTGSSHITAVSGSNVAMVLAMWSVVFPGGRHRRRLAVQAVIVLSILAYAMFVGMEPPVSRAAMVAGAALFAARVGRTPDIMTLLGLSAAILAVANPGNVHLASYWLSIVASVAIAVRLPTTPGAGVGESFRSLVEGVVVAQVATTPLILIWFGSWSPTSIFANVLLAPLMAIAFPLCFLLAGMVMAVPAVAQMFAIVPQLTLEMSLAIVRVLARALPPVSIGATGPAAYLAVAVPCLLVVATMAREGHRWWPIVGRRWREQPRAITLTVVAPIAGFLIGLLAIVTVW